MRILSKTWWGQELIAALTSFTDYNRLTRGRSYSSDKRIKEWNIKDGVISASILGNANPYYGVHKAPTYKTTLSMKHLTDDQWEEVIALLSVRAGFISRLLVNEIPENIEEIFSGVGANFLPHNYRDFKVSCSCPDYETPCKHIAGVCYRLASLLDHDPLLLFEMRGITPEKLREELLKSPLGKILAEFNMQEKQQHIPTKSYFTRLEPETLPKTIDVNKFWCGKASLPAQNQNNKEAIIPAIAIKKGGDYPKFWHKPGSFIEFMDDFYLRMRKNIKKKI